MKEQILKLLDELEHDIAVIRYPDGRDAVKHYIDAIKTIDELRQLTNRQGN